MLSFCFHRRLRFPTTMKTVPLAFATFFRLQWLPMGLASLSSGLDEVESYFIICLFRSSSLPPSTHLLQFSGTICGSLALCYSVAVAPQGNETLWKRDDNDDDSLFATTELF